MTHLGFDLDEQVRIIEAQVNSEHANFTLMEKCQYIHSFFKPDFEFSQQAIDIVLSNLVKGGER